MKLKKRYLNFFLFEYETLQEYLKEMAKQGWMLNSVSPQPRNIMTFEECIPKEYYFYVDFISNYDFWYPDIANDEVLKYRSLIEEYGYVFLASSGPMQIFISDVAIDMPIREQSIETKKEMRKASIKYTFLWFIAGAIWLLNPLTTMINGHYKYLYFWTSGQNLQTLFHQTLYAFFLLSFVFPVIRWMIKEKKRYPLWRVKLRSTAQLLAFVLIIVYLFAQSLYAGVYWLFVGIVVSVLMMMAVYEGVKRFLGDNWKPIVITLCCGVLLLVGTHQLYLKYGFTQNYETKESKQIQSIIPPDYMKLDTETLFTQDVEESMYIKDEQYSCMLSNEESVSYDVVHIKDTLLDDFIRHSLTTKDLVFKKEVGKYVVYMQDYRVWVQERNTLLSFGRDNYPGFTQQQLDVIFDKIES